MVKAEDVNLSMGVIGRGEYGMPPRGAMAVLYLLSCV